jgi:hypothetical protein
VRHGGVGGEVDLEGERSRGLAGVGGWGFAGACRPALLAAVGMGMGRRETTEGGARDPRESVRCLQVQGRGARTGCTIGTITQLPTGTKIDLGARLVARIPLKQVSGI